MSVTPTFGKKSLRVPPPLLPVQREDSASARGLKISETGTLQLDLLNGQQVAVRPGGVTRVSSPDVIVSEDSPELLGKIQWSDLRIGHIIGEGAQGRVRLAKHRSSGTVYALKIIDVGEQVSKRTLQLELSRVLELGRHPNVVASVEAFFRDGALRILMEFMNLGTLRTVVDRIGPIPPAPLSEMTRQILEGLASLHDSRLVHRDLKPSNLLVNSQGFVKVSDFGVSTLVNSVNPYAHTMVGSQSYMSPERMRGEKYNAKSDIWSIGVTVAQCALGVYPFIVESSDDEAEQNPFERRASAIELAALFERTAPQIDFEGLIQKLAEVYPTRKKPDIGSSPQLVHFVRQCMKENPAERPSCRDLLRHPFITEHLGEVNLAMWMAGQGLVPLKPSDVRTTPK